MLTGRCCTSTRRLSGGLVSATRVTSVMRCVPRGLVARFSCVFGVGTYLPCLEYVAACGFGREVHYALHVVALPRYLRRLAHCISGRSLYVRGVLLSHNRLSGHNPEVPFFFACNLRQHLVSFHLVFFAGLALPVCENLATALFVKGLNGQQTEGEAWNVLEYIRQRGMVHRPEVIETVTRVVFVVAASRSCTLLLVLLLSHTPTARPERGGRRRRSGDRLPRGVRCLPRSNAHPTRKNKCRVDVPTAILRDCPPQQQQLNTCRLVSLPCVLCVSFVTVVAFAFVACKTNK